jgi:hypothetical protein
MTPSSTVTLERPTPKICKITFANPPVNLIVPETVSRLHTVVKELLNPCWPSERTPTRCLGQGFKRACLNLESSLLKEVSTTWSAVWVITSALEASSPGSTRIT